MKQKRNRPVQSRLIRDRIPIVWTVFALILAGACSSIETNSKASPTAPRQQETTESVILISPTPTTVAALPPSTTVSSIAPCPKPSVWQIRYVRSGGFAGWTYSLDLSNDGNYEAINTEKDKTSRGTLSPEELTQFEDLALRACPFLVSGGNGLRQRPASCPDCFSTSLEVRMGKNELSFSSGDNDSIAPELSDLLSALVQFLMKKTS